MDLITSQTRAGDVAQSETATAEGAVDCVKNKETNFRSKIVAITKLRQLANSEVNQTRIASYGGIEALVEFIARDKVDQKVIDDLAPSPQQARKKTFTPTKSDDEIGRALRDRVDVEASETLSILASNQVVHEIFATNPKWFRVLVAMLRSPKGRGFGASVLHSLANEAPLVEKIANVEGIVDTIVENISTSIVSRDISSNFALLKRLCALDVIRERAVNLGILQTVLRLVREGTLELRLQAIGFLYTFYVHPNYAGVVEALLEEQEPGILGQLQKRLEGEKAAEEQAKKEEEDRRAMEDTLDPLHDKEIEVKVARVVEYLEANTQNRLLDALESMKTLFHDKYARKLLLAHNIHDVIMSHLNHPDDIACMPAMQLVAILITSDEELKTQFLRDGLASKLLELNRIGQRDVKLMAKKLIDKLSEDPDIQIMIAASGGPQRLVILLQTAESVVKEKAVNVLRPLCLDAKHRAAIMTCGGVEAITDLLVSGTQQARTAACTCLFNLATSAKTQQYIAASGGIEHALSLLDNGIEEAKVEAMNLLGRLALLEENRKRMMTDKFTERMIGLLDDRNSEELKASSAVVMGILASEGDQSVAIMKYGGISKLLKLIPDDPELMATGPVSMAAAGALVSFSTHEECRATMIQEGCVTKFLKLVDHGTQSGREQAAISLRLLCSVQLLKPALSKDGVNVLLAACTEEKGNTGKRVREALAQLIYIVCQDNNKKITLIPDKPALMDCRVRLLIAVFHLKNHAITTKVQTSLLNLLNSSVGEQVAALLDHHKGFEVFVQYLRQDQPAVEKLMMVIGRLCSMNPKYKARFVNLDLVEAALELVNHTHCLEKMKVMKICTSVLCEACLFIHKNDEEGLRRFEKSRGVNQMITLIHHAEGQEEWITVSYQASNLLADLSSIEDLKRNVVAQGTYKTLAMLCRRGEESPAGHAAVAVKLLSTVPEHQVTAAECGVIEALMDLLRVGSDSAKGHAKAALKVLSQNAENQVKIASAGGVERLLSLLPNASLQVRVKLMMAIGKMTDDGNGTKPETVVPQMMEMLESEDLELQCQAALNIASIARKSDEAKVYIKEETKGLMVLARLIKYSENAELMYKSIIAMNQIVFDEDTKDRAWDAGVSFKMRRLIREYEEEAADKTHVSEDQLSDDDKIRKDGIKYACELMLRLIPPRDRMVEMLSNDSELIRFRAVRELMDIATSVEEQNEVWRAGALKPLKVMMGEGKEEDKKLAEELYKVVDPKLDRLVALLDPSLNHDDEELREMSIERVKQMGHSSKEEASECRGRGVMELLRRVTTERKQHKKLCKEVLDVLDPNVPELIGYLASEEEQRRVWGLRDLLQYVKLDGKKAIEPVRKAGGVAAVLVIVEFAVGKEKGMASELLALIEKPSEKSEREKRERQEAERRKKEAEMKAKEAERLRLEAERIAKEEKLRLEAEEAEKRRKQAQKLAEEEKEREIQRLKAEEAERKRKEKEIERERERLQQEEERRRLEEMSLERQELTTEEEEERHKKARMLQVMKSDEDVDMTAGLSAVERVDKLMGEEALDNEQESDLSQRLGHLVATLEKDIAHLMQQDSEYLQKLRENRKMKFKPKVREVDWLGMALDPRRHLRKKKKKRQKAEDDGKRHVHWPEELVAVDPFKRAEPEHPVFLSPVKVIVGEEDEIDDSILPKIDEPKADDKKSEEEKNKNKRKKKKKGKKGAEEPKLTEEEKIEKLRQEMEDEEREKEAALQALLNPVTVSESSGVMVLQLLDDDTSKLQRVIRNLRSLSGEESPEASQRLVKGLKELAELAVEGKSREALVESNIYSQVVGALTDSKSVDVQRTALETLHALSHEGVFKVKMHHTGIIPLLMDTLEEDKRDDVNTKLAPTCALLWSLAKNSKIRGDIVSQGAIPHLLEVLTFGSHEGVGAGSAPLAAGCLWMLSLDHTSREEIARQGGVEKLVRSLATSNSGTVARAGGCLANLATEPSLCDHIVDVGIEIILEVLRLKGVHDDEVRCKLVGLLRNLSVFPQHKASIVKYEAIDVLVDCCMSRNEDMQIQAAGALKNLSLRSTNKALIAYAGGVHALVDLLNQGCEEARAKAAGALWNLSVNQKNKELIGKIGGIFALVEVLQDGNDEAKAKAAGAVGLLCTLKQNQQRIADHGGVGVLISLLGHPVEEVASKAAAALWNLAVDDVQQSRIGHGGGVQALLKLISPHYSIDTRTKAMGALANVAKTSQNAKKVAKKKNLKTIISALSVHGSELQLKALALMERVALDEECHSRLVSSGLIEAMGNILKASPDNMKTLVCAVVKHMAVTEPMQEAFANVGVLKKVVGLLQPQSADMQVQACKCLNNLLEYEENKVLAVRFGAIRNLVACCKHGSTGGAIFAAAILSLLAKDNRGNQIKIANAGAIEPLIDMMWTSTMEGRAVAVETIHLLSENEQNQERIGRSGGIEALIDIAKNFPPEAASTALDALAYLSLCESNRSIIGASGVAELMAERGLWWSFWPRKVTRNERLVSPKKVAKANNNSGSKSLGLITPGKTGKFKSKNRISRTPSPQTLQSPTLPYVNVTPEERHEIPMPIFEESPRPLSI